MDGYRSRKNRHVIHTVFPARNERRHVVRTARRSIVRIEVGSVLWLSVCVCAGVVDE
jgi:hypothetical protein